MVKISLKASFVTTVFNGSEYIERAVLSGLQQTMPIVDYVIVDDGSTDDTLEKLEALSAADSRIRLVAAGRVGRQAALNIGIKEVSGDIVFIQDADDYSLPGRVAACLAVFEAADDVGIVAGAYRAVELSSGAIGVRKPPRDHETFIRMMSGRVPICHTSACFRKRVWVEVGGYQSPSPLIVDLPFWLATVRSPWKFKGLPDVLVVHHYYDQSNFAALFHRRRRASFLFRLNVKAFRLKPSLYIIEGAGRVLTALVLPSRLRKSWRRRWARLDLRSTR